MGTHTFSVSFLLRKCKADKARADIYARITIDGDDKEFSTKEQIATNTWDSKRGRVKGNSVAVKAINEHLDNIQLAVKSKYRKLIDDEKLVTAETVRDAYVGVQTQLKGHSLKDLTQYFKKIWEHKLAEGNFKNYRTTISYLELFLQKNYASGDVYLSQVDGEFATNFEHYIRTNPIKEHDFEWDVDGTVWCKIYRTKSDELCTVPILPSVAFALGFNFPSMINPFCSANFLKSAGVFPVFALILSIYA